MIVYLYMYMHMYIFMNMYAYMLLRSTTQYYVVLVLGSTSTSTTTVAASTVGYGGDHTMGVGGGTRNVQRAPIYIYNLLITLLTLHVLTQKT